MLENRPRECKDDIGSIERWSDVFIIFMDVYLSAHPHKLRELLHYFYTIRECAANHGGPSGNSMTLNSGLDRPSCRPHGPL